MRIYIRCCCTPRLVLGAVDVPDEKVVLGGVIHIGLVDGSTLEFEVKKFRGFLPIVSFDEELTFPQRHVDELALHSNDVPLDTLRRSKAFIEINRLIDAGE